MAKKPAPKPMTPAQKMRAKLGISTDPTPKKRRTAAPANDSLESRTEGTATGGSELEDIPVEGVPLDEATVGASAIDEARAKMEAARAGVGNVIADETGTAPAPAKKKSGGNKSGRKSGKGAAATTTTTTPPPNTNTTTATPTPKASNPNAGAVATGPGNFAAIDWSKYPSLNAGQPTPGQVPTNQNVINPGKPSGLLPAKPEPPKPPEPTKWDKSWTKWALESPDLRVAAGIVGAGGLIGWLRSGSGVVPNATQQQAQAAQQLDFSKPLDQQMRPAIPADQPHNPANTIRQLRPQESF